MRHGMSDVPRSRPGAVVHVCASRRTASEQPACPRHVDASSLCSKLRGHTCLSMCLPLCYVPPRARTRRFCFVCFSLFNNHR